MSSPTSRFAHRGVSWSETANIGELSSVLNPLGSERVNLMIHSANMFGARKALALSRKQGGKQAVVLDFGCGNGRIMRFFARNGLSVVGTDVTVEMLLAARQFGIPQRSILTVIDGVSIPLRDQSLDMIWVCGVLKYSLFEPGSACRVSSGAVESDKSVMGRAGNPNEKQVFVPVYRDIAQEMYRVLKPGGYVANLEMWVDALPDVFLSDFEQVGFNTEKVRVLRRYQGYLERLFQWRDWHRLPPKSVLVAGRLCATVRYWLDNPRRTAPDFRDYLFIWSKPRHDRNADSSDSELKGGGLTNINQEKQRDVFLHA